MAAPAYASGHASGSASGSASGIISGMRRGAHRVITLSVELGEGVWCAPMYAFAYIGGGCLMKDNSRFRMLKERPSALLVEQLKIVIPP